MIKKLPPLEELLKRFEYKDGCLYWKIRAANRVKIGDRADSAHKITGYLSVSCCGQRYQSHRVVWKILNKEEPVGEIDHINGNRKDNRIENLRLVNKLENLKNQKVYKNNRSGTPGVYWNKRKQKWCVQITNDGEQKYYGCFKEKEEAVKLRKELNKEFSFHENHGR